MATPVPESLAELRLRVAESYQWRRGGRVLTQEQLEGLSQKDRDAARLGADMRLVEELVEAERAWTDELWRRRQESGGW